MTKFSRTITVCAALCLALRGATADELFVQFVGVTDLPGESTDAAHPDWIDAFALDHSSTSPGGGAPQLSEIAFLKGADKATPKLQRYVTTGAVIPNATIDVCRDGVAGQECYYRIELKSVSVRSVAVASSACVDPATCGGPQTESVTLAFTAIKWQYTQWDQNTGKKGAFVEQCWDVAKNTASCF